MALAPSHLVDAIAAAKVRADRGSPVIDQLTFADFLTRGEFDRHLRRMRPVYRRRRDALLAALPARLPELEPVGVAAGQHVVAWLPAGPRRGAVVLPPPGAEWPCRRLPVPTAPADPAG